MKSRKNAGPLTSSGAAEVQLIVLLGLAVVFGGGGSKAGYFNLVVELAALAILAINGRACLDFFLKAPMALRVLVGLSLLLPLLQAVPLPPFLWARLPGRALAVEALDLVGSPGAWLPFSLVPNRTVLAFLAVVCVLPIVCLGVRLNDRRAARVAAAVGMLGLVNVAFGAVQLASANRVGNFYSGAQPAELYGTFSNHNSAGLFLVFTLVIVLTLPRLEGVRPQLQSALRYACAGVLCLAVLLTRSRSSIALLAAVLLVAAPFILASARRRFGPAFGKVVLAGGAGTALLAAAALWFGGHALHRTAQRFDNLQDARVLIWQDASESALRYLPVGAGMGAFDQVFQVDESLENVRVGRAGRAHNDYLEVAVEAGIPGLLLLVGWLSWTAWAVWSGRQAPDRALRLGAGGALACVAAQSAVDYPLRNLAVLAVSAFAVALLARPGDNTARRSRVKKERKA